MGLKRQKRYLAFEVGSDFAESMRQSEYPNSTPQKNLAESSKQAFEAKPLQTGDPNFMTTLARGLRVISAFSGNKGGTTMARLCSETGLSRACVRRCLYTLEKLGFANADGNGRYYLRVGVLALGYSYISSMPLSAAAQPVLTHLSDSLHESCSIAVIDSTEVVYIARVNVARIVSTNLRVGSRLPAFCTSTGRIFLAFSPPDVLETYLTGTQFHAYTSRTVTTPSRLRQILRTVRQSGHCILDQELEPGLRAIAVPVWGPTGEIVAAVNVSAHAQRVSIPEMRSRFLPALLAASKELSKLSA